MTDWLEINADGTTREGWEGRYWHAPDVMSSEIETGDFMYGLIRLVKPRVVIETGCHRGATTMYMARAIKNNGIGKLYSCDILAKHVEHVRELLSGWPLDAGKAEVHQCSGIELIRLVNSIDLAFIDSGAEPVRCEEAKVLNGNLRDGGLVILHDAHRPEFDCIKAKLPWTSIKINTPRGIAIFQK